METFPENPTIYFTYFPSYYLIDFPEYFNYCLELLINIKERFTIEAVRDISRMSFAILNSDEIITDARVQAAYVRLLGNLCRTLYSGHMYWIFSNDFAVVFFTYSFLEKLYTKNNNVLRKVFK